MSDLTQHIQDRRAALAAQMEQARQEYARLEQMLMTLGRNLDAMHGGVQELDALIEELEPCADPPSS